MQSWHRSGGLGGTLVVTKRQVLAVESATTRDEAGIEPAATVSSCERSLDSAHIGSRSRWGQLSDTISQPVSACQAFCLMPRIFGAVRASLPSSELFRRGGQSGGSVQQELRHWPTCQAGSDIAESVGDLKRRSWVGPSQDEGVSNTDRVATRKSGDPGLAPGSPSSLTKSSVFALSCAWR